MKKFIIMSVLWIIFSMSCGIWYGAWYEAWVSQAGAYEPMPCDTQVKVTQTVDVSETVPKLLYFVGTWLWVKERITWNFQNHRVPFDYIDNELTKQMKKGIKAKAATQRLIKKMCKED